MGPFTYESRKIGLVRYFLLKKGANHIPGSAAKWVHSTISSVLCHIEENTPPPHTHTHTRALPTKHQSFVVPAPTGPEFSLQCPAKRPALRGQTYGKIPAKSPYTPGPVFVSETGCSLSQNSACICFMAKGLVTPYSLIQR